MGCYKAARTNSEACEEKDMTNLDMGVRNSEFVENPDEVPSPFISGTNLQFAVDSTSL